MSLCLPGISSARVEQKKIAEYLLNLDHPQGASKARFFQARGFSTQMWG
jgi:hypothetical protein